MFVKIQHSDTSCFRIFNSAKTSSPNVGFSVTPPLKKSHDGKKQKNHKQVLQCPSGGGGRSAKDVFFRINRRRIEENVSLDHSLGARGRVFNGKNAVLGKEDVAKDCLLETPDVRVQKTGSFETVLRSSGGVNVAEEESRASTSAAKGEGNGVLRKEKVKQNSCVRKSGGTTEKTSKSGDEMKSVGVVEKMQTKCSMKWARYGGCIPAMLGALETTNDLDEALKPWEMTLTNKERSIILKEQLGWQRAMEIFEWFKRKGCYEVNVIHYNIMLRILGKAHQWCELERLLDEMGDRGIKPVNSTYGTLIDVYCKGGHRDKAMKWLESMNESKMEPDEVTMGIVLQMYKKAGDFATAEKFFKKWSHSNSVVQKSANSRRKSDVNSDSSSNIYQSTYTYNTLIDTYGKAGKMQEATEMFEKMLRRGVVPSNVTFNTMIHMYGNNGRLDEVASLMQRMKEAKCTPDNRTYNILISLHAKHNDIELSARYLREMREASLQPDAVSYRTILYAFSIRHMVAEAEALVSEMDERGMEIDEFTQSALTRMYIEAGMLENSWSWFEKFHLSGNMTSECYSAHIDAFGERGYILEAERVFDCCLNARKLSVLAFNVMVKAYGISKKFEEACCLFDSMEKHGLIPDICGYNSLVVMLSSADLPQKAVFYLRKMRHNGLVIDCAPYCAVISSYAKLGHMDMAAELYKEMIGHGIKPDVIVYGVLINAFAEMGSVEEAACYVNAMRKMGVQMNGVVYKSLIKLYTKVGYLKEAQEVYNMLHSFEEGLDVYSSNCMIDLYSERSMVSEAEEIFENMKRNGDANEFSYAMMLCMYKRNARFVEAYGIARKMRELGLMTELLSYNVVLGLYASDGRCKEAVSTFDEMMDSGVQPDDYTFRSLRIILLKCGVPQDAVDKLEMRRKKDAESGLHSWASVLSSVVVDDDDDDEDDVNFDDF